MKTKTLVLTFLVLLFSLYLMVGPSPQDPSPSALSDREFAGADSAFATATVSLVDVLEQIPNAQAWEAFIADQPPI